MWTRSPGAEVLTPDLLRDVFGVEARVVTEPVTGRVVVHALRSAKRARHLAANE